MSGQTDLIRLRVVLNAAIHAYAFALHRNQKDIKNEVQALGFQAKSLFGKARASEDPPSRLRSAIAHSVAAAVKDFYTFSAEHGCVDAGTTEVLP